MKNHSRKAVLGAIAIAGIATLAACSAGTAPEAPDEGQDRSYSAETIDTFLEYTGSSAGEADESAEPVKIGWVNQDSGPGALPELTGLSKSAVNLINTQLGGIDGHPLVLETCDIQSEEDGLACGQKFANDDSVLAIAQGNIITGTASFHSAIDPTGIPIVGALPLDPADGSAPNGYYIASGSFSTVPAMTALLTGSLDADSVAIISIEGEFISSMIAGQMAQSLSAAGLTVSTSSVTLNATDATAALVASGAADADVIVPLVITPPQCIGISNALDGLESDADVLALGACYSNGVRDGLGDYPAWTYLWGYTNTAIEDGDAEVQAQIDAYNEWYEVLDQDMDAVIPLQTALTLQKHILAAGGAEASREAIGEAAKTWEGPIFLGPPTVAYGAVRSGPLSLPAIPSLQTRAYHYNGGGDFTDITDGEWVG